MLAGHMRVAERYIVYRAERALLRARRTRPRRRPRSRCSRPTAEVEWTGADLRERIAFASIGLDLALDADGARARAAAGDPARDRPRRPAAARGAQRQGADGARQRVLALRRPHPAHLRLRGDAGLGHRPRRHRRAEGGARARARRGAAPRREDRPDRPAAARVRPGAARRRARSHRRPGLRLPRPADALRPLPAGRQDAARRRAGSRRRSCSGCGWRWASASPSPRTSATRARSTSTRCTASAASAPRRRRCSTPARCTRSSRRATSTRSRTRCPRSSGAASPRTRCARSGRAASAARGPRCAARARTSSPPTASRQGVVPFLKMHNDQLVAVNQGGKRAGSGCAYLEVWHNDIREFLELRRNTGDERRRTHDMNTACWIPDLFMQRVEARGPWTLFRSNDVPDLHETYGRGVRARATRPTRRGSPRASCTARRCPRSSSGSRCSRCSSRPAIRG